MNRSTSRRRFMADAASLPWLSPFAAAAQQAKSQPAAPAAELARKREPILDIHVHLFGIGEGGTGCRIAKSITDGLRFNFLVSSLSLKQEGKTLDERYETVLAEEVSRSGFAATAILAQDAAYDRHGKPDWERTSFYVPNDYLFDVVARHPGVMVPCPSINPERADALEELARCHERGARMLKIHPPTQGVDVGDERHKPFFRRCAELDVVVLVHTGHEHSAPVIDKALAAPRRLRTALDEGCTVVACHAGTGWSSDSPDQLPEFLELLDKYPKLWGDTSVLGTAGRVRDFKRLVADPAVKARLLHGSDFPFPVVPIAFAAEIGIDGVKRVAAEPNRLNRDLALKEAMGVGLEAARRGYDVLKIAQRK